MTPAWLAQIGSSVKARRRLELGRIAGKHKARLARAAGGGTG